MDEFVKFKLNRRLNLVVNLMEFLDQAKKGAFTLERDIARDNKIYKFKVAITKEATKALQDKRAGIIKALEMNVNEEVYTQAKDNLRIEVQKCSDGSEGVLTIACYYPKSSDDEKVSIRKCTFLTILQYVDNDFNVSDEWFDEKSVVKLEPKGKKGRQSNPQ